MILVVQAALSVAIAGRPLVQDEATYAIAGNAEIAHLLHGMHAYSYQRFLSGAPVIYPPLSSTAVSIGGLIGARLLSLAFMLVATAVLWSATRLLFGSLTALLAAAVFAATASTQLLGALATYDAMALALLAGAAWCAVKAGGLRRAARNVALTAMVVLLVAANATKYATALWDPVVIATAALASARHRGWRKGLVTGVVTGVGGLALGGAAVMAAGHTYATGILFTTVDRTPRSRMPAFTILAHAAPWAGLVTVLAICGAALLTWRSSEHAPTKVLAWVLTTAAVLAPLNHARIGVETSLFKHVDFGAWFAAIPAGHGLATMVRILAASRRAAARAAGLGTALLVLTAAAAIGHARVTSQIPTPYSGAAANQLKPMLARSKSPWLGDTPTVIIYYTRTAPWRWRNTYRLGYTDPATGKELHGKAAYTAAIRHHYFTIVVLSSLRVARPMDQVIVAALRRSPGYHLTIVPEPDLPTYHHQPQTMYIWRYYQPTAQPSHAQAWRAIRPRCIVQSWPRGAGWPVHARSGSLAGGGTDVPVQADTRPGMRHPGDQVAPRRSWRRNLRRLPASHVGRWVALSEAQWTPRRRDSRSSSRRASGRCSGWHGC